RKALRVDDGGPDLLHIAARRRECHMPLSGPMASLAIDALRNRLGERHFAALDMLELLRNLRIGVVTEHALVVHRAHRPWIVRLIVTWAHIPRAAPFRVPAQRQLLKRAAAGEVQIRLGMI